jgi:DNA-binding NarL/FixJ family response regulator
MDRQRPARVVVVDANASLAGVLAELLEDEPDFTVVGTATHGDDAVRLAQQCEADLFLVDERLDDALSTDVLRALRESCPCAAVMLWSHHEVHTASEDVDGVLRRGMTFRELVRELRAVLRSRAALSAP